MSSFYDAEDMLDNVRQCVEAAMIVSLLMNKVVTERGREGGEGGRRHGRGAEVAIREDGIQTRKRKIGGSGKINSLEREKNSSGEVLVVAVGGE